MFEAFKDRVTASATAMFKHAEYPLAHTLDHRDDPGLCGPGSVSWEVIGDPAAFIGGLRALLVQAAHPEVAAGVSDHSRYRQDPLGRLSRTSNYVTATTYGAMPEVEYAVAAVKRMHTRVAGVSHRGIDYSAETPEFAAWVHNALTDSFLGAFQVFGRRTLSESERDRFVIEQGRIGALLDADPIPQSAADLRAWLFGLEAIGDSPGRREAVSFLRNPPLRGGVRIGQRILFQAAAATLPRQMRRLLGVRRLPGAILVGRSLIGFLRWTLGHSPSWNLALVRVNAPIPPRLFRQPLPIESLGSWGTQTQSGADGR